MSNFKAIETRYKGYKFRSRLEARWAVFLDTIKVAWQYEKEGYDLSDAGFYLPDFYLPDLGFWVEIKGTEPTDDERRKAMELSHGSQQPVAIQVGLPDLRYEERFGVWMPQGGNSVEIYAGYPTDKFSYPPLTAFIDYYYGPSQLESLSEMLSGYYGQAIIYDGTDSSIERIVELDKDYFYRNYGRPHHRWQWGKRNTAPGWLSEKEGDLGLSDGFINKFTADAYRAARSARFEHGENR